MNLQYRMIIVFFGILTNIILTLIMCILECIKDNLEESGWSTENKIQYDRLCSILKDISVQFNVARVSIFIFMGLCTMVLM